MAFPPYGSSSSSSSSGKQPAGVGASSSSSSARYLGTPDDAFDIFEWYPHFQSCVRYFIEKAQHTVAVQAVAALINIRLPFQNAQLAGTMMGPPGAVVPGPPHAPGQGQWLPQQNQFVSLNPYIRRLVATGWDVPDILHGFFGDDWSQGISHIHESERRNYLFASKSSNWLEVKSLYDMDDDQSIPYLRPLQNVTEKEIMGAESTWSEWLAMQDWMIGPRAPEAEGNAPGSGKREAQ